MKGFLGMSEYEPTPFPSRLPSKKVEKNKPTDIFGTLAAYADTSFFGLGGMSIKAKKLYKDFGLEPNRDNGHQLALALAKKYVKGFKPAKTRGRKKKWDDKAALEFYLLVQIHNLKNKCSLIQSIKSVAKNGKFPEEKVESQKARYYERLKKIETLKQWDVGIKGTKLTGDQLRGILEEVYSENF
jgi:hypothetical protein